MLVWPNKRLGVFRLEDMLGIRSLAVDVASSRGELPFPSTHTCALLADAPAPEHFDTGFRLTRKQMAPGIQFPFSEPGGTARVGIDS